MKTDKYKKDILNIVERTRIINDGSYVISDREIHVQYQHAYFEWHEPIDAFGKNDGLDRQLKTNMLNHLTQSLYSTFYISGNSKSSVVNPVRKLPSSEDILTYNNKLSQANKSVEWLDPYWQVYHVGTEGNIFVKKDHRTRQLVPNSYQLDAQSQGTVNINSFVHVKVSRESRSEQPGFYHAFSNQLFPQQVNLTRVYFNIKSSGSEALITQISTLFNRYNIPFQFKCANHPDLYERVDAAVLYLAQPNVRMAFFLLNRICKPLKKYFRKKVPLFTLKLKEGLSFAEDPGLGQSFGMNRCHLLANAILSAHDAQIKENRRGNHVCDYLKKHGLKVKRFYRRPHSHYIYDYSLLSA